MDDEINLKDYIDVLVKNRRLIFYICAASVIFSIIISLLSKPVYEAKALILVRSVPSSPSMSALAGISSQFGIGAFSSNNLGDLNDLIKTKSVADDVLKNVKKMIHGGEISKLVLLDIDKKTGKNKKTSGVLGTLKTKINGIFLEVTVENKDPNLAAIIADSYVESLSAYWNKLNITGAKKKKDYIEKQLPVIEANLKDVEDKLKNLTYLSDPASNSNPSIELERLKREMEIQSSVYTMLRREYESAKLEEIKDISPFSDIEKAEVPQGPVRPRIKLNVMIGAVIGLFLGIFAAFFKEYIEKEYKR